MSRFLAFLFLLGAGFGNLYLLWTRALGAEIRSWWWFAFCGTVSVFLTAAHLALQKESK